MEEHEEEDELQLLEVHEILHRLAPRFVTTLFADISMWRFVESKWFDAEYFLLWFRLGTHSDPLYLIFGGGYNYDSSSGEENTEENGI